MNGATKNFQSLKNFRKLFEESHIKTVNVAEEVKKNAEISKIFDELKAWKWIYGKSPKFQYSRENKSIIEVKDGLVLDTNQQFSPDL